jgi:hypothetical protein
VAVATAVIGLGPLFVSLGLRLPPINQLNYADAWFYSAYAWVPGHHFAALKWNYFSVRFPAILSIGAFERVFGVQDGYLVLRYVMCVCSGTALYLGVRRFGTASVAVATVGLLYLNPFFSRMLLWDYAGFVTVSAGVAGLALWWWSDGRSLRWTFLPGIALALAFFANAIAAIVLVVLLAVEALSAVRAGRPAILRLAARLGIAGLSAAVVFIAGYLSYMRFSSVTPDDLVRPTIDFLRSSGENSAPYQRPDAQWLLHDLRIWAPVVASLALVFVLRGRVLATSMEARIAQVCIGYTGLLWLYRFAGTSSVIETWWAYDLVVIVLAPALGVLLHVVATEWSSQRSRALIALGVSGLSALFIRTFDGGTRNFYDAVAHRSWLLLILLGLAVGAAFLLGAGAMAAPAGALGFFVLMLTVMMWAPSVFDGRGTTGVFAEDGKLEWDAYLAGDRLVTLISDYDAPGRRVYTWYPGTTGVTNISWTTLPQLGTTVQLLGVHTRLSRLLPLGRARLLQPDAAYVLAMSTRASDLLSARHALVSAGFSGRSVRRGSLADGRLQYVLIALMHKPAA